MINSSVWKHSKEYDLLRANPSRNYSQTSRRNKSSFFSRTSNKKVSCFNPNKDYKIEIKDIKRSLFNKEIIPLSKRQTSHESTNPSQTVILMTSPKPKKRIPKLHLEATTMFNIKKHKHKNILSKVLERAMKKEYKMSLTERKSTEDNISFLKAISNVPDRKESTSSLSNKDFLLFQTELRRMQPNSSSSLPRNKKNNSCSKLTHVDLKENNIVNVRRKATDNCVSNNLRLLDSIKDRKHSIKNHSKRKDSRQISSLSQKLQQFSQRDTYENTMKEHRRLEKQKLRLRFKVMDEQLYNYNKSDYVDMNVKGDVVNVDNLLRLSRFLSIVRYKNKNEPISPDEIENKEYNNDEVLLNRDYTASKTLEKLGQPKYIKTFLRPNTIRKFNEKNGIFMGKS